MVVPVMTRNIVRWVVPLALLAGCGRPTTGPINPDTELFQSARSVTDVTQCLNEQVMRRVGATISQIDVPNGKQIVFLEGMVRADVLATPEGVTRVVLSMARPQIYPGDWPSIVRACV